MTLDETATTVTVTGSTSVAWAVSETTTAVDYAGTVILFTTRDGEGGTPSTIEFAETFMMLSGLDVSTTVFLGSTEVGLSYDGTMEALTLSNSEEETSSREDFLSSRESTSMEEASSGDSTVSEELITSVEETSATFEESTTEFTGTESDTSSSNTNPTEAHPTYCEVIRGPLTPEEEVQPAVLFGVRKRGTTFADYVVSYASELVAQIADVANIAVGDNDYAFTTALDSVDIPGVLGLASAAPIYTCFLSSLWAQALSNPQQYAKRAVPSQDRKIKLIVLFEKRATDGMQFDYAELLIDEANNLIAEVQSIAGAAG